MIEAVSSDCADTHEADANSRKAAAAKAAAHLLPAMAAPYLSILLQEWLYGEKLALKAECCLLKCSLAVF